MLVIKLIINIFHKKGIKKQKIILTIY